MANRIQSLLGNRILWFPSQMNGYKFLKYVTSKTLLCEPTRTQFTVTSSNISSHRKWNICQTYSHPQAVLSNVGLVRKLGMEKIEQKFTCPNDEKENCNRLLFEQSNDLSLFVDKTRVEEINSLIKEKEIKNKEKADQNRPSKEQVDLIAKILAEDLKNFFSRPLNYHIYHKDLLFENHIRGTQTIRLEDYIKQVSLVRAIGHLKYAYVEFQVLKMTTHYTEGAIKVRWRIKGLSGFRVFINFWRYKIWNLKGTAFQEVEAWYDGFSILYLKGDGLVHKHVLLKMQPDEDNTTDTVKPSSPVAA